MISNNIVKQFGGDIDVISTPNKGSIFTFTIKLSTEDDIKNL